MNQSTSNRASIENEIFQGRYRIGQRIGGGSFGEIHVAVDLQTGEKVACKIESLESKHPQLYYEYRVYGDIPKGMGVPRVITYGTCANHAVMVMDLLGQSLESLFNICQRKFTMKTLLMLTIQLIDRVEYLHGNGYLHRDIKPDNFLIGSQQQDSHVIYMVDMGLCKRFIDKKTHRHIPHRSNKKLTGTPRYASIRTHQGNEQSRRDDLESLGYMLIYFLRGSLPWQGIKAENKEQKYRIIGEKKASTSFQSLCRGYPHQFVEYMEYCHSLGFSDKPDYLYLKTLFDTLFRNGNYEYDWVFDWDDLRAHSMFIKRRDMFQKNKSPSETGREQLLEIVDGLDSTRNKLERRVVDLEAENDKLRKEVRQLKKSRSVNGSGLTTRKRQRKEEATSKEKEQEEE